MTPVREKSVSRTVRRHQLREIVPLADSTIYEMEQRGEFPQRFALSPRCVVWDLAEVEAWLAARRSVPIARAQSPDVRQRRSRPVVMEVSGTLWDIPGWMGQNHSHSIVPGGLLVTSYTTRLTPLTSLMMRVAVSPRNLMSKE
jgi:prophage regulatory protein